MNTARSKFAGNKHENSGRLHQSHQSCRSRNHRHQHFWPEAEIVALTVPSGVSEMPMSDDETITGARNRARAAREAVNADLGFGLEGGVHSDPLGLLLQGWVVVTDGNGREGVGMLPVGCRCRP